MIDLPGGLLTEVTALISALSLGSLPLAKAYVIVSNQRRILRAEKRRLLADNRDEHQQAIQPSLDAA